MGRIIGFLIVIIDVLAIVDILKGNKDTEKKLLWVIAVIFLPLLGPFLYYFIGRKGN